MKNASTTSDVPEESDPADMESSDPSTVVTMKLPLSGSSSTIQRLKFTMTGRGTVPSRQNAPHPHSIFTDPSGKFLLSADLGADVIRIFSINTSTGMLTECPTAQAGAGDGPRHGAFWTAGGGDSALTMLYTINELSSSVTSWKVTYPASGGCMTLAKKQTISNYGPGKTAPQMTKAAEIRVKGNFVYASNRNDQTFGQQKDSLATYSISPATGDITFVELTNAQAFFPRTFEINKMGDMVAVGGQTSSNVAIIARNTTTGRLGSLIATLNVGTPGSVNQEDGLSAVIWNE
jgi:6-phosphogluconolactonase (cycloisomerase 2 family)